MAIASDMMGDVTVAMVRRRRQLDASNAAEFKRDVAPLIEATTKLVFDLSRLRFVDSSGLGAFISCLRKLNAKGGDLKLCGMSKQVRAVFERLRPHASHLRHLRHERGGGADVSILRGRVTSTALERATISWLVPFGRATLFTHRADILR